MKVSLLKTDLEKNCIHVIRAIQEMCPALFIEYYLEYGETSFSFQDLRNFLVYSCYLQLMKMLDHDFVMGDRIGYRTIVEKEFGLFVEAMTDPRLPISLKNHFDDQTRFNILETMISKFFEKAFLIQTKTKQIYETLCYGLLHRKLPTENGELISQLDGVARARFYLIHQIIGEKVAEELQYLSFLPLKKHIPIHQIIRIAKDSGYPLFLIINYLVLEFAKFQEIKKLKLNELLVFLQRIDLLLEGFAVFLLPFEIEYVFKNVSHLIRYSIRNDQSEQYLKLLYCEKYFFCLAQTFVAKTRGDLTLLSDWNWKIFCQFFNKILMLILSTESKFQSHEILKKLHEALNNSSEIFQRNLLSEDHLYYPQIVPNFTEYIMIHDDEYQHEYLSVREHEHRLCQFFCHGVFGPSKKMFDVSLIQHDQESFHLIDYWHSHFKTMKTTFHANSHIEAEYRSTLLKKK